MCIRDRLITQQVWLYAVGQAIMLAFRAVILREDFAASGGLLLAFLLPWRHMWYLYAPRHLPGPAGQKADPYLADGSTAAGSDAVSYTHLDVYKRQFLLSSLKGLKATPHNAKHRPSGCGMPSALQKCSAIHKVLPALFA